MRPASSIHKRGHPASFPMFSFALKTKWGFKVKYKSSGHIDKSKYSDTCSPIIKSNSMRTTFATRGDGDYYVGFKVMHRKEVGIVFLHQTRYINEVLKRFHMIDCNPVSTLAGPHVHSSMQSNDPECIALILVPYKEAVDCLMFASVFTCPNIVRTLAKNAECP